jgi:hypothetical protein
VDLRPIVTIARAQIEPGSDAGLPDGQRMPKLPIGPTKLIAVCDGMIEAARAGLRVQLLRGAKRVQLMSGGGNTRPTEGTEEIAA